MKTHPLVNQAPQHEDASVD